MTGPRRVHFRETARQDSAPRPVFFVREASVRVAVEFLTAVENAVIRLQGHPVIGRTRHFRSEKLHGLRSWPVPGFQRILIFYLPIPGGIDVVRVIHASRDLPVVLAGA